MRLKKSFRLLACGEGLFSEFLNGGGATTVGTARGLFGTLLPLVGLELSFGVGVIPFLSRDGFRM